MSKSILDRLQPYRELVDRELVAFLPDTGERPGLIHQAMRYSGLAPGKRLRPVLASATGEMLGGDAMRIVPVASAVELIHAYSLIHDDLPCMDDDDMRRGLPTCHRKFGEAIAVLAGDALLTCAFEMIIQNGTRQGFDADTLLRVIAELCVASGSRGMIAGQVEDLLAEGREVSAGDVAYIHAHKTGKLFTASFRVGALLARAKPQELDRVTRFGDLFGQAFQITDDIIDLECSSQETGKPSGSDLKKGKATYPSVFSMDQAKRMAQETVEEAASILDSWRPGADLLIELVRYLPTRRS